MIYPASTVMQYLKVRLLCTLANKYTSEQAEKNTYKKFFNFDFKHNCFKLQSIQQNSFFLTYFIMRKQKTSRGMFSFSRSLKKE